MTNKIHVATFGCQMNVYDSNKIVDLMGKTYDFAKTDNIEEANLLVVNTCSVREKAQEKLFSLLGRWRKLKQLNPEVKIAVGGCVASQEGEHILKRAPYVDIIFGPQTLHKIPALYQKVISTQKPAIDISFPEIEKFDHLPKPKANGPIAFVSIMEGCSKYCSFCIVPYTRGKEISRPFDDVLYEVAQLAEQGVKEINLLGQNVNDYRGLMTKGEYADLALLISYIATIDSIKRIRFTTSHPLAFSQNLIEAYGNIPKLANHLHLPVQSGSDKVLGLMKRGYTVLEYENKIKRLKEARPNIPLSTDLIVGFPGETSADFMQTMDLVAKMQYDTSFSFIYSKRPGTPAASLPDFVSLDEKKSRLNSLQTRLSILESEFSQAYINKTTQVLVTGKAPKSKGFLSGRTECNRVVNFPASDDLIGSMQEVTINSANRNILTGTLVL